MVAVNELLLLERIKRLGVKAMFADDELFDQLVLKGGNAMDLIHRLSSRASVDLDFSMQQDFPDGIEAFRKRVERTLVKTFRQDGFEPFDIKFEERPKNVSAAMATFWGGYAVEFKLIDAARFRELKDNLSELRKHALRIGQGQKFLIDVSRFEYTTGKQEADLDGYRIYVYSPEMIVCEKIRAICQSMAEYGPIVMRSGEGSVRARARDFLDIHVLVEALKLDVSAPHNLGILVEMFRLKKVPLEFLDLIGTYRELHRADFPSVKATLKAGTDVKEFDEYFDYVLVLVENIKSALGQIAASP
ncbi:MAG: nucleotidyl transferase AbiEii/AbiGii toxin family protein [Burkholderiales bacterium]|jgi:hypothetical protein|nr:nucleotidyl transferase AbiEii/AbiGii toxin family protein [Burkholderiales bacterium]